MTGFLLSMVAVLWIMCAINSSRITKLEHRIAVREMRHRYRVD